MEWFVANQCSWNWEKLDLLWETEMAPRSYRQDETRTYPKEGHCRGPQTQQSSEGMARAPGRTGDVTGPRPGLASPFRQPALLKQKMTPNLTSIKQSFKCWGSKTKDCWASAPGQQVLSGKPCFKLQDQLSPVEFSDHPWLSLPDTEITESPLTKRSLRALTLIYSI